MDEGEYDIGGYKVKIRHFPGHTPGSVTIEIGDEMFSGDFAVILFSTEVSGGSIFLIRTRKK